MRKIDFKYFLYARKSSESEDRQMASIEDQISEVKKLAEKLNINIIDIISESKSAKEPGRIGFNSMLNRISKGEADGILTWKLNRLARNPIDGGQISWMLQKNIIKHIQTFEKDYNPSDNVLLMQVEFGMANQYIKDLSLDVKRGMRQKAERGWYPITNLPCGYMHNPRYIHGIDDEIIPHPEQFPILKKLWQLMSTGKYTISDMKRKGDSMGLKDKRNKELSQNTYGFIFRNKFYCGYFNWKDKDGNINHIKGKHKPLVSPVEFEKVQILLNERNFSNYQVKKYDFPYRGLIKCGECGCGITPDHKLQVICTNCKLKFSIKTITSCPRCNTELSQMKKPTFIDILYYHCSKSRGKCSQKAITRQQIESSLENELSRISIPEKFFSWATNCLKSEKEINKADNEVISKGLRKRKKELEHRISRLIDLRADGEIDSEQFNLSQSKTHKEIIFVENEIKQLARNETSSCTEKIDNLKFALNALELFKKGNDLIKRDIIIHLSSNLTLMEKKLLITIRKPLLEVQNAYSGYDSKNAPSNLTLSL